MDVWDKCIDIVSNLKQEDEEDPTKLTIKTTLFWLSWLRDKFPNHPPTCIIRHPYGGLLVERRYELNGRQCIFEVCFLNDDSIEVTDWIDGKIVNMKRIENVCSKSC